MQSLDYLRGHTYMTSSIRGEGVLLIFDVL